MKLSQAFKDSLKELIEIAGDDINEVEIEKRLFGWKVRISRGAATPVVQTVAHNPGSERGSTAEEPSGSEGQVDGIPVTSPMVGTFYTAPSPDADPFVKAGDLVSAGQTVCIIEAMKIMNEIEAEVGGRITKILLENGAPVEYNTPLFLIELA